MANSFLKDKKQVLVVHTAVWLVFFIICLLQIYSGNGDIALRLVVILGINFIVFYVNYLFLVPHFLLKKKTFAYLLLAAVLIALPVFVQFYNPPGPPPPAPPEGFPMNRGPRIPFHFFIPFIVNLAFVVVGTSIKMYSEWNQNEIKKKEIENQKSKTELHFLKNQLSPHFLFNSLNSIYSLCVKKSSDAPEAVITLSELMRYMLYQTNTDVVPLKDELEYIQNFLKLQRIRIANNENVTLNIKGPVTDQKIRPLLLISFIENAFKYGTDFRGNTEVKIAILVEPKRLRFSCVNLIGREKAGSENAGIGLANTKERLNLLYPDRHLLEISEEENRFVVNLVLELS
ncbi:sensor histidine kinase [Zunongwangia sp. H14]|uniref:sensor histidine kinase n=1 Tax=Zunongwangia sp. H14 TaxID=3240792 RepID=UPI003562EFE3